MTTAERMDAATTDFEREMLQGAKRATAVAEKVARLKFRETLRPREVETLFGIDAGTLANWRSAKGGPIGPPFSRMGEGKGALIFYEQEKVREWIQRHKVLTVGELPYEQRGGG